MYSQVVFMTLKAIKTYEKGKENLIGTLKLVKILQYDNKVVSHIRLINPIIFLSTFDEKWRHAVLEISQQQNLYVS